MEVKISTYPKSDFEFVDTTIATLLKSNNASIKSFVRFEVGEGIEKKEENFADEVMAQVKG